MTIKSKITISFFLVILACSSASFFAQKNTSIQLIKQLDDLYMLNNSDSLVSFSDKILSDLKTKNSIDSLLFANVYFYNYLGKNIIKADINNKNILEKSIVYCPKSISGDSLKAVLYNSKAYLENNLGNTMKSYKSISKSAQLLEGLPNPNPGYLMGAYLLLSNHNAFYGNFDQAKYFMRLAESVYKGNKAEIDKNTWDLNGNHQRLGVIAKYRKIYMLWKLKSSNDSTMLINTMNDLKKMHAQPNFHPEERIYYSTALNHVGDWFTSYKHDSLLTQKDIKSGLKYLFKSLDLLENKGYPRTIWAIKYNIAKGFTKGNQLQKADSTMTVLFHGISKTDGRLPFFFAQKALIKAKKGQKDSALFYFDKSIQKIHLDNDELKANYSNFKPSKSYNHTKLLLRISEELNNYYPNDSIIQKKVAKLYFMALQQFENSYLSTSFNSTQNDQLRKIIHGILKAKKTGYLNDQIQEKSLLNKYEIFKNQLAWKKFYESRYTNTLPELDSIKERKLALASLLNKAKITDNISQTDSIQNLINKHKSYIIEEFPQLELLSDFEFSIEKVQEELTSKDLILKYILLENEIAIYQISKSGFQVHLRPWTKKEKNNLIDFIEKTCGRNYDSKIGSQLAEVLFPTIDGSITHLIINPDGMLFKLPFETLQTKGKFATEHYNFSYTSNLGFINYKSNNISRSEKIHIYAPIYSNVKKQSNVRDEPSFLNGASNEAKSISKLFPSKLFNTGSLTKSEFIKTAGKGKILHLAMHAEVHKEYPELSRLLFSKNLEKEDDHLYLEELYGLSLNADLAILSACNTGAGVEKNGSLESFQRAFTFAGVPATVASLWEVPDTSTKEIMVLFYKNLKTGQTKSEALQNAKITYKKENSDSKLAAPYYWAGFVIYGNDTPIVRKNTSIVFYVIIPIIIILFGVFLIRRRNKKSMI